MKTQKGFGLIGILITIAIIAGIAGGTFYALQNVGSVDSLDRDGEKQSVNSALRQTENVAQKLEEKNSNVTNELEAE